MSDTTAERAQLPSVSIIVPTYRREAALRQTIERLDSVDYPPDRLEVIVIDDGSAEGDRHLPPQLSSGLFQLKYLNQPNRGVASARNHGARQASGNVLIFLDDDILVEPDMVRRHVATLSSFSRAMVNGHWEFEPSLAEALAKTPFGRYRLSLERWVKEAVNKTQLGGSLDEVSGVTACNLAVRRDDFWSLGGFDEEFPYAGCEDQDLSLRAGRAGFKLLYDHSVRLWHNDHRLSLLQFCERQRRGAVTAVLLALKHRELLARPLIAENSGLSRRDSPAILLKKSLKFVMSRRPLLRALFAMISLVERIAPRANVLRRSYWGACGLYIYLGVREGLARFPQSAGD